MEPVFVFERLLSECLSTETRRGSQTQSKEAKMKPTRKRFWLPAATAGAVLLLLVVACQPTVSPVEIQPSATQTQTAPADTPSPAAPAATATQPQPPTEEATPEATLPLKGLTPMPASSAGASVAIPPAAKAAVAAAKADLAQRLGVNEEEILVRSIEAAVQP